MAVHAAHHRTQPGVARLSLHQHAVCSLRPDFS